MGLRDRLRANESALARIDRVYERARKDGVRAQLAALSKITTSFENNEAFHEYHRLTGTVAMYAGDRELALWHACVGLTRIPYSSHLHLLAGRMLEESGHIEEALPHFRAVQGFDATEFDPGRHQQRGAKLLLEAAHFLYLWDDWVGARAALEPMLDIYFALGTAAFLSDRAPGLPQWAHGLPLFDELFRTRAAIDYLAGEPERAQSLLDRAVADLDKLDGHTLQNELDAWLSDPGPLLESLTATVGPGRPIGPSGLQLVLWRQRVNSSNLEAAVAAISDVDLWGDLGPDGLRGGTSNWLEYMRQVGLSRAHRAAGDPTGPARVLDDFLLKKVTRLQYSLKPEDLFRFGLIEEGEQIKAEYRKRRLRARAI